MARMRCCRNWFGGHGDFFLSPLLCGCLIMPRHVIAVASAGSGHAGPKNGDKRRPISRVIAKNKILFGTRSSGYLSVFPPVSLCITARIVLLCYLWTISTINTINNQLNIINLLL